MNAVLDITLSNNRLKEQRYYLQKTCRITIETKWLINSRWYFYIEFTGGLQDRLLG